MYIIFRRCVCGEGGWGGWEETHIERLAGENWTEGAPGCVVPMGQLRGPFLQRWTPRPRAPPPFPFNSVATWGLLWWQLWSWWLWDYSSSVTLTTSHEVRRGKGREGGRRWSWKKGEEGEGRGGCPKTFLPHSTTFLITLQSWNMIAAFALGRKETI